MNGGLLLLLIIPILWTFGSKFYWKRELTYLEIGITLGVTILSGALLWQAGKYVETGDIEILNGQVTGKYQDTVSCSHSYSCNCRTVYSGSGKNRTSSTKCDTCYEHMHDYDWVVETSVGKFNIDRVDRQGASMPGRWSNVIIGEPASLPHSYTNYIKAAPNSLFHEVQYQVGADSFAIPTYPEVYDYYRVNHVLIPDGAKVPPQVHNELNQLLSNSLRTVGPSKQANVNIVFTKQSDQSYRYALERTWAGGKKNDITIVVGVPEYPAIEWVDVITWAQNKGNENFAVQLRDALQDLETVQPQPMVDAITKVTMAKFDRPNNEDFKHLEDQIEPPTWMIVLNFIITMAIAVGLTLYFTKNDWIDRNF